MVVLDMGHMTVQSSLLTNHKGGLPTHLVHCSHPRRGVHDLQFKMLALIDQEKPGVLENINKHMETTGTTGKAHQFWDLMCKCVERASGCTSDDERLDLQVAQSMMVDDFLMEALDAAGGITAGDVRKLRPVVGEAASKVIETLLTLNEMHAQTDADTADASATGYTQPTLVALTGGGCPMPEVIEAVKTCMAQKALPDQPPVKLLLSKGGNSPVVAQGAALLGCDYLQQLLKQGQLSQQEQQQGVVRPQQQQDGAYSDLLPSLWPTRSGSRHIAVWCGFAPGKVREDYKTAAQLRDLQLRVHAAAITPDGQPDWPKRKQDTQRLNSYLEHLISKTGTQQQQRQQQQQQPRVNPPTGIPIFLSLLRPGEHLPRTASIPTLRKPPGDSLIRIKLLEIDQLYGGEEVLLTTYNVVGAKKNTDVDVSVQFSAEGRIDSVTAEAVVAISKGKIQRQPLEVVLQQHDSMEPARKDQQKALGRLPELAQKFQSLRSGLLLETDKPATPPAAAAAASAAAAGNAGSSAGLGASASSLGAGFGAPAASGAPGLPGAIPQDHDAWHDADAVAAAYGGNGGQPSPEFMQQLQALMMLQQQQQHQQQQPLLHQQPQQPLLHQQPPFVGMDSTARAAEAAAAAFMQALTPQVRQQLLDNTVQYAAAIGAQHAVPFGVPGSLLRQHHDVQHAVHVHNSAAGVAYQADEPIQPNRLQAALPLQLLAQEPLSAGAGRHGIPMSASAAAMATATAREAGSGGASSGQGVKRHAHAGATGYEPAYKRNS